MAIEGKPAQILEVLKKIKAENPDIEALSVVSLDGLPISSLLPEGAEEDRIAALSATILSLGERAAEELKKGTLEQAYVKGASGYVIVQSVKNMAALMIVTNSSAKLGMVMLSIKEGLQDISRII